MRSRCDHSNNPTFTHPNMSPHRQALAIQLSRNFDEVCIWAREEATVAAINDGENTIYFPGFRLPESIKATTNKDAAVSGSDKNETILVLIVVPTPALEEVVSDLRLDDRHILVSCTKGILNDTLETPDAILTRVTGFQRVAFLSGPSFAKEVAENQPTVGVDPLTWTDVPARPDAHAHSLFCSLRGSRSRPETTRSPARSSRPSRPSASAVIRRTTSSAWSWAAR